jgi:hypothetical protein
MVRKITDKPVPILNRATYCTLPWTYTNGSGLHQFFAAAAAAAAIPNDISQLKNVRSKLRGSSYAIHSSFSISVQKPAILSLCFP